MNDLSDNKYLTESAVDWNEYSLNEILSNSFALERDTDAKHILFYITTILASMGFRYGANGFKYLAMLVTMYIIKNGYDEQTAFDAIADIYGTDAIEVKDSITACIVINGRFAHTASELLQLSIGSGGCVAVSDAVEIVGAVYKKYYNFTTADESITDVRGVNYVRLVLNG